MRTFLSLVLARVVVIVFTQCHLPCLNTDMEKQSFLCSPPTNFTLPLTMIPKLFNPPHLSSPFLLVFIIDSINL